MRWGYIRRKWNYGGVLMYYCYRHIRLDKKQPFYIGIGKCNMNVNTFLSRYYRMHNKIGRNDIWNKITQKSEWVAEILYESNNLDEIKKKEMEFISLYRRMKDGGLLCNMTDGGDGVYNLDKEKRDRVTNFNKGSKRSPESIDKMRQAKRRRSKNVKCETNSMVFESCADAERYFFGKRNKYIYNALTRMNGVYGGLKFIYIE